MKPVVTTANVSGLHFRLDFPLLHRAQQAGHLRVPDLQLHQRLDHVQGHYLRQIGRPVMDSIRGQAQFFISKELKFKPLLL